MGLGFIIAVVNLEYTMDFEFLQGWAVLVLRVDPGVLRDFSFCSCSFLRLQRLVHTWAVLDLPPAIDCDCWLPSARLMVRPVDLGSGSWMCGGFLSSHDLSLTLGRSCESGPWE